eukprot:962317-Pleurochrysis_carterae.AAC.1
MCRSCQMKAVALRFRRRRRQTQQMDHLRLAKEFPSLLVATKAALSKAASFDEFSAGDGDLLRLLLRLLVGNDCSARPRALANGSGNPDKLAEGCPAAELTAPAVPGCVSLGPNGPALARGSSKPGLSLLVSAAFGEMAKALSKGSGCEGRGDVLGVTRGELLRDRVERGAPVP